MALYQKVLYVLGVGPPYVDDPTELNKKEQALLEGSTAFHKFDESTGKLLVQHLPTLAINEVFPFITSDAQMTALNAQRGDVAIRTDFEPDRMYMLSTDTPGVVANWVRVTFGDVISVNGQTGVINITPASIGASPAAKVAGQDGYVRIFRTSGSGGAGDYYEPLGSATVPNADEVTPGKVEEATNVEARALTAAGPFHVSPAKLGAILAVQRDFITGCELSRPGTGTIRVGSGAFWVPGLNRFVEFPTNIDIAAAQITGIALNAKMYVYGFENAGVPGIEVNTTAPVAYYGTAMHKTGDNTRRYLGMVLGLSASTFFPFVHNPNTNWIDYQTHVGGSTLQLSSGFTGTAETTVSAAVAVAPNTRRVELLCTNTSAQIVYFGNADDDITLSSTAYLRRMDNDEGGHFHMPLAAALSFTWRFATATSGGNATVRLLGYELRR